MRLSRFDFSSDLSDTLKVENILKLPFLNSSLISEEKKINFFGKLCQKSRGIRKKCFVSVFPVFFSKRKIFSFCLKACFWMFLAHLLAMVSNFHRQLPLREMPGKYDPGFYSNVVDFACAITTFSF